MRFKFVATLMTLACSLSTAPASAQAWGSIDMSMPLMNSSFAVQSFALNADIVASADRAVEQSERRSTSVQSRNRTSPNQRAGLVSANPTSVPERLAQSYPAQQRQAARDVFRRLLTNHGDLMARFNLPRDDLAGAMASYIAGAWMAYNNRPFPDAYFLPLVEQMRPIVGSNSALADASPALRRQAFEEFAILGMMAAGTQIALSQNPDNPNATAVAANMRAAGASYLRAATSMDPNRVRIGADGLSFATSQ